MRTGKKNTYVCLACREIWIIRQTKIHNKRKRKRKRKKRQCSLWVRKRSARIPMIRGMIKILVISAV